MKPNSPGNHKRSQWLKDARARLSKPTTSSDFDQKSKAAALQQTKENESEQQKLLYSSSVYNRGFTTINKSKLKFSPTVKKLNVETDSPGTPPYEIVTSSNPNDFMNDNNEPTQCAQEPSQPSCSYSTPIEPEPKGIIKSTPRMDRIVNKIWKQPNHEDVTTLDDSSTEDFPVQPSIKQIEVEYLDSSEGTNNSDNQNTQDNEETTRRCDSRQSPSEHG